MKNIQFKAMCTFFVVTLLVLMGVHNQRAEAQISLGKDVSYYQKTTVKEGEEQAERAEDLSSLLNTIRVLSENLDYSDEKELKKYYRANTKAADEVIKLRRQFNQWIESSDKLFRYLELMLEEIDYVDLRSKAQAKLRKKALFIEVFRRTDIMITNAEEKSKRLQSIVKVIKISGAVDVFEENFNDLEELRRETSVLTTQIIELTNEGIALLEGL